MKIIQGSIWILLSLYSMFGYTQKTIENVPFYTNSGLVHYYFWEENERGEIIDSTFRTPFTLNTLVLFKTSFKTSKVSQNELQSLVEKLGRPYHTHQKVSIQQQRIHRKKVDFTLLGSLDPEVVVFIKKNGVWSSHKSGRILYFKKIEHGPTIYNRASKNKLFISWNSGRDSATRILPYNTYRVISTYPSKENSDHYDQIKGYYGHDLTEAFMSAKPATAKRYLLFVNGYRGPMFDNDPSKNEVYMNDRTNYWFNIDNRFVARLQPDTCFYLDGSFTVKTSNHHSKIGFGLSYLKSTVFASEKHFTKKYRWLNTSPNVCGFDWRKRNGYNAGRAYLNTIRNLPVIPTKDTIDLVCHSMGYAYTLGFIEAVQQELVVGKLYILAPENANAGSLDWSNYLSVYQYGANLGQTDQDILAFQDGVAPQTGIKGLPINGQKYGRFFSPKNWPNKQFIHSHMVYSFDWIFDRILPNEPGYIH